MWMQRKEGKIELKRCNVKDVDKVKIDDHGGSSRLGMNGYIPVSTGKLGLMVGRARVFDRCGEIS